jgi:hypothetical protein
VDARGARKQRVEVVWQVRVAWFMGNREPLESITGYAR